jgi:methionyl-tRNA formyltransferase
MGEVVRTVFMGTPEFSVPSLTALLDLARGDDPLLNVVGVFTQPDRPAGRGKLMTAPPVKLAAGTAGLPVFQPERLRRPEAVSQLADLRPDLIVVAAYAQILSPRVLGLPRFGCLNVHASLLPRYRGASPIHAPILDGESQTGVTVMQMEKGLDTGPILKQSGLPIGPNDTTGSLSGALATLGASLLVATLPGWLAGTIEPLAQDDSLATMTKPLTKEQGRIDWSQKAVVVERLVRAMSPWPGAYTALAAGPLKVHRSSVLPAVPGGLPGTLVARPEGPAVVTGDGLLLLVEVQPAGRRAMPGPDWLHGAMPLLGTVLGQSSSRRDRDDAS